jgi:hypothetical protein
MPFAGTNSIMCSTCYVPLPYCDVFFFFLFFSAFLHLSPRRTFRLDDPALLPAAAPVEEMVLEASSSSSTAEAIKLALQTVVFI